MLYFEVEGETTQIWWALTHFFYFPLWSVGGGNGSTIEGSSGGKGSSLNDMSDVGPIRAGGRKRMRVESEEEEEEEESGEGGFGSVVRSRVRRGGWGVS